MTFAESIVNALVWYIALSAAGLLTYPLLYQIARELCDRGLSLHRPVGLAIIPLPLWITGNLTGIPFTPMTVIASGLLIGVPAWLFALTRTDLVSFLQNTWLRALIYELATLFLFLGYVVFRGYHPDIAGTEKPMELAFLNAAIQSPEIPVADPWFAGETINYYYFGYVALAGLAMVTSIPGEVAFNLGLATAFSLATMAAAGLAANLSDRMTGRTPLRTASAGILAGFMLSFSGNLHAPFELIRNPSETLTAGWWDGVGWSASRVIEDTRFPDGGSRLVITEFPAFSWILGDLHPHVIALPWLITALALVVNLSFVIPKAQTLVQIALPAAPVGIAIGVLYSSNSWDVPFIVAALIGFLIIPRDRINWRTIVLTLIFSGVAALLAAGSFAIRYSPPAGVADSDLSKPWSMVPGIEGIAAAVGYVSWDRTSVSDLITVWGGFLALIAIVLIANRQALLESSRITRQSAGAVLGVLILVSLLSGTPALIVFGIPLLLVIWMLLGPTLGPGKSQALVIAGVALLILIAIEFVFLKDPFGDRMNTVFKFAFQAWAALAIAVGATIPSAVATIRNHASRIPLTLVSGGLVVTLLLVSVYTPLSAYRWSSSFHNWHGIDGAVYIARLQPAEYAAITWIQENVPPGERVLEAPGCAYGTDHLLPHNRVSMLTGRPTIIGWDGHQYQWRRGQQELLAEIGSRIAHAGQIYESPTESGSLIDDYGIDYVFVGQHEITGYQRCEHGPPYAIPDKRTLAASGWELRFQSVTVRVYAIEGSEQAN